MSAEKFAHDYQDNFRPANRKRGVDFGRRVLPGDVLPNRMVMSPDGDAVVERKLTRGRGGADASDNDTYKHKAPDIQHFVEKVMGEDGTLSPAAMQLYRIGWSALYDGANAEGLQKNYNQLKMSDGVSEQELAVIREKARADMVSFAINELHNAFNAKQSKGEVLAKRLEELKRDLGSVLSSQTAVVRHYELLRLLHASLAATRDMSFDDDAKKNVAGILHIDPSRVDSISLAEFYVMEDVYGDTERFGMQGMRVVDILGHISDWQKNYDRSKYTQQKDYLNFAIQEFFRNPAKNGERIHGSLSEIHQAALMAAEILYLSLPLITTDEAVKYIKSPSDCSTELVAKAGFYVANSARFPAQITGLSPLLAEAGQVKSKILLEKLPAGLFDMRGSPSVATQAEYRAVDGQVVTLENVRKYPRGTYEEMMGISFADLAKKSTDEILKLARADAIPPWHYVMTKLQQMKALADAAVSKVESSGTPLSTVEIYQLFNDRKLQARKLFKNPAERDAEMYRWLELSAADEMIEFQKPNQTADGVVFELLRKLREFKWDLPRRIALEFDPLGVDPELITPQSRLRHLIGAFSKMDEVVFNGTKDDDEFLPIQRKRKATRQQKIDAMKADIPGDDTDPDAGLFMVLKFYLGMGDYRLGKYTSVFGAKTDRVSNPTGVGGDPSVVKEAERITFSDLLKFSGIRIVNKKICPVVDWSEQDQKRYARSIQMYQEFLENFAINKSTKLDPDAYAFLGLDPYVFRDLVQFSNVKKAIEPQGDSSKKTSVLPYVHTKEYSDWFIPVEDAALLFLEKQHPDYACTPEWTEIAELHHEANLLPPLRHDGKPTRGRVFYQFFQRFFRDDSYRWGQLRDVHAMAQLRLEMTLAGCPIKIREEHLPLLGHKILDLNGNRVPVVLASDTDVRDEKLIEMGGESGWLRVEGLANGEFPLDYYSRAHKIRVGSRHYLMDTRAPASLCISNAMFHLSPELVKTSPGRIRALFEKEIIDGYRAAGRTIDMNDPECRNEVNALVKKMWLDRQAYSWCLTPEDTHNVLSGLFRSEAISQGELEMLEILYGCRVTIGTDKENNPTKSGGQVAQFRRSADALRIPTMNKNEREAAKQDEVAMDEFVRLVGNVHKGLTQNLVPAAETGLRALRRMNPKDVGIAGWNALYATITSGAIYAIPYALTSRFADAFMLGNVHPVWAALASGLIGVAAGSISLDFGPRAASLWRGVEGSKLWGWLSWIPGNQHLKKGYVLDAMEMDKVIGGYGRYNYDVPGADTAAIEKATVQRFLKYREDYAKAHQVH